MRKIKHITGTITYFEKSVQNFLDEISDQSRYGMGQILYSSCVMLNGNVVYSALIHYYDYGVDEEEEDDD